MIALSRRVVRRARFVLDTLISLTVLCFSLSVTAKDAEALTVTEVAPGVFVHQGQHAAWAEDQHHDVANLGFVVGQRCVAVIDTGGSPAVGRALRASVAAHTPLPVCYVINTHVHPDHVLGNSAFIPPAGGSSTRPAFVGHSKLTAALTARGPAYLTALERDLGVARSADLIVYPDKTVESRVELDLGGRVLELRAWPTAHTDNDLSVLDVESGTFFAGDLVFRTHLPVIDGRLLGWLGVMDQLVALPVQRLVPGHGAVTHDVAAALAPQRHYLTALRDGVRAALTKGQTIGQTVDGLPAPHQQGWLLVDEFHRRNVTAAFAELEWED